MALLFSKWRQRGYFFASEYKAWIHPTCGKLPLPIEEAIIAPRVCGPIAVMSTRKVFNYSLEQRRSVATDLKARFGLEHSFAF